MPTVINGHPDMTYAVDWALRANYLSDLSVINVQSIIHANH